MSIKIDCNEVIIKNNSLLQNYKNGYSKSVLDDLSVNGWKSGLLAPDYKDDFSDDYKSYLNTEQINIYKSFVQSEIYFQLVKTIIVLQKELYTIFEKSILIEQLNKLMLLFFDILKSENDIYWRNEVEMTIQAQFEGYLFNGVTYPEPKDFTKEYVTSIVNSLLKENKEQLKVKDYTKETWFIVGLKFVDGTVYDYEPAFKKGLPLVRKVFEDDFLSLEEATKQKLINKYKHNVDGSLGYGKRTLFKKDSKHESQWYLICNYHIKQGKQINKRFEEQFLKTYGVPIK